MPTLFQGCKLHLVIAIDWYASVFLAAFICGKFFIFGDISRLTQPATQREQREYGHPQQHGAHD